MQMKSTNQPGQLENANILMVAKQICKRNEKIPLNE